MSPYPSSSGTHYMTGHNATLLRLLNATLPRLLAVHNM